MFKTIMIPVDLAHEDRLGRALSCAADLTKHYEARAVYVGVTSSTPSKMAHNPKEFEQVLKKFADGQGEKHGIDTASHAVVAKDPAIDLDDCLLKAVDEVDADLVVMASHVPNLTDYVWPSNGGSIAGHAKASVFVVRGQ